jgi:hypothetical protein
MKRKDVTQVPSNVVNGQKELHEYLESLEGKKNYSDFPEMQHNPFICLLNDELHLEWSKKGVDGNITTSISSYVNQDTGESSVLKSTRGTIFSEQKYVDSNTYTKIYNKNLREMFSLSSGALKLFGYFMSQLNFRDTEGMIYMDLDDAIMFCDYGENSRSVIYRGLTDLILRGFICKTNRPWTFYINPKYVHNGDRIAVFKEYIKQPQLDKTLDEKNRSIENW